MNCGLDVLKERYQNEHTVSPLSRTGELERNDNSILPLVSFPANGEVISVSLLASYGSDLFGLPCNAVQFSEFSGSDEESLREIHAEN